MGHHLLCEGKVALLHCCTTVVPCGSILCELVGICMKFVRFFGEWHNYTLFQGYPFVTNFVQIHINPHNFLSCCSLHHIAICFTAIFISNDSSVVRFLQALFHASSLDARLHAHIRFNTQVDREDTIRPLAPMPPYRLWQPSLHCHSWQR